VPRSGLRAPACTYARARAGADTRAPIRTPAHLRRTRTFATGRGRLARLGSSTKHVNSRDACRAATRLLSRRNIYRTPLDICMQTRSRPIFPPVSSPRHPRVTVVFSSRLLLSRLLLALRGCLLGLPSLLRLYRTVSALLPVAVTLIALSPQWGTKGETKRGAVRISY